MIMKKYLILTAFFVCFSTVSIFAVEFWYLDVTVPRFGVQRAYFFKDLKTLETATGFPNKENEERINRYRWNWAQNPSYRSDSYHATIISVMRNEGFAAAFILDSSGRSITGEIYYSYSVYLIQNGILYFDGSSLYNNPVNFP